MKTMKFQSGGSQISVSKYTLNLTLNLIGASLLAGGSPALAGNSGPLASPPEVVTAVHEEPAIIFSTAPDSLANTARTELLNQHSLGLNSAGSRSDLAQRIRVRAAQQRNAQTAKKLNPFSALLQTFGVLPPNYEYPYKDKIGRAHV